MSLTSPTLGELQSCRESLSIMYVNGIMDKPAYDRAMAKLNESIDARITPVNGIGTDYENWSTQGLKNAAEYHDRQGNWVTYNRIKEVLATRKGN